MTTAESLDVHDPAARRSPALVVLLGGPSGSGKSSLAARTGLPVLHLDDFYRAGDDPSLPLLPDGSGPDWDSPLSWDADAAVAAIGELARTGRARVPVYSIAASAVTGKSLLALDGAAAFVAEGIFAADLVARCRAAGLPATALCLSGSPLTTAWRRLRRDLRESRKPVPVLLRRGWRLLRAERGIVARQTALGAEACSQDEALTRIHRAATAVPGGT